MNVLAILPAFIPSTIIGVLRPLADMERRREIKFRVRLYNVSILLSHDIDWCDVAVFCRNCEIKDLAVLYELKRKGKKVVYEIDDNFEEIPLTTDIGIYHRQFFRLHVLRRFFALSDVTRVFSDRLLQRAVAHGARTQLIRSYFDKSIIDGLRRKAPDDIVRIAYPTGRIDDAELEERIFSAVRKILQKYDGKVEFHLWRKSVPRQLTGAKGVVLNKGVRGYDNFVRSFFRTGFDIGLAPGLDTPFFHSKTNNKYREFGGCDIAGIYSNFPPYSNSVTHGYTGLLAGSSTEEWVAAIDRLIADETLRAHIAKNAADDVFRNYSFETAVESWRECIRLLKDQKSELPDWIPPAGLTAFIAYVNLVPANETDDLRYKYLTRSLSSMPGSLTFQFSSASEYLESSSRRFFSASIFIISSEKELETLTILLPLSNSVIVDMTTYGDDVDSAIRHVRGAASGLPMSFMLTHEHAETSVLIKTMPGSVLLVEIKPMPIAQELSLLGYPAAYLELVERHIRFGTWEMKSGRFARLCALPNVIADRYAHMKGRFETVFMWLKWRLGFRQC